MNLLLEKKQQSSEDVIRLVSMLESLDYLTVTVMAAPAEQPCTSETSSCGCTAVLSARVREDDFANATWEDAEWQ